MDATSIAAGRNESGPIEKSQLASKGTIFVFSHKAADIPRSCMYRPIALGSRCIEGFPESDSDGRHTIADLNPYYCELTGVYWAWKNTTQQSFVGTAHYRRFLSALPLSKERNKNGIVCADRWEARRVLEDPRQASGFERLLDEYDLVLPRAYVADAGVGAHYLSRHGSDEWGRFLEELDERYGRENHSLRLDRRAFWGNIFVCKPHFFDWYCENLFAVIDTVFRDVGKKGLDTETRYEPGRYPGYLAERFMTAFINVHRLKYFEADVVRVNQ